MYVFHYVSDKELTPTLDHEHTDFGYYKKDEMPEDIYYLRKFFKMKKILTELHLMMERERLQLCRK